MSHKIRWGIIGTGTIANTFAADLQLIEGAVLQAVASRELDKAEVFGYKHQAIKSYGSYEALAADPDVDVVYISTPHVLHKENTILCLNHKKAVLCEKPMATNAEDTREMIDCAKVNGVFLMEAMWTRFLPQVQWVRDLIDAGEIGDIRWMKADFGFALEPDYPITGRLLNKALGGGSLLDVGIYPLSFVQMIMKKDPVKICSSLVMGATDVDLSCVGHFIYDQGEVATIFSSIQVTTEQEVHISGTKGAIHIPNCWFGDEATITYANGDIQHRKVPRHGKGYTYEIEAVNKCLKDGQLESAIHPLDQTLKIMELADQIYHLSLNSI